MRIDALHFDLPTELIAQRPEEDRRQARLMVLGPSAAAPSHRRVADLVELVPPRSLVVVNDTRVIPARLLGRKVGTGGRTEVLLLAKAEGSTAAARDALYAASTAEEGSRAREVWHAMAHANKSLKPGTAINVFDRADPDRLALTIRILTHVPDGTFDVSLETPSGEPVAEALRAAGHVPLPPYITRPDGPEDVTRYQTIYARHDGAVAAPTAGLHLTEDAMEGLAAKGCEVARVTLHVGLGTFRPVQVDDLDQHPMHAERLVVSPAVADAVAAARARGAPVVAVGTTTLRALESTADADRPGLVLPAQGETRLLIQPGYAFRIVDVLLTNFHLPRSTLLALVGAFAGLDRVLDAYRQAVAAHYRFFSYGDAMLLWRDR